MSIKNACNHTYYCDECDTYHCLACGCECDPEQNENDDVEIDEPETDEAWF